MASYPANFPRCATCVNWGGPKRADNFKTWIECNESSEGYCPVVMCEQRADSSCGSWEALYPSS